MRDDVVTRRRLLGALSFGGTAAACGPIAGIVSGQSDGPEQHVISVNSPGDVTVSYEFTVSGSVEPSTHVPQDLPHDEASVDPDDTISGGTVSGATRGGVDSFAFTGELTSFTATNCEEAAVWIDGDRVDACSLPPGSDGGDGADGGEDRLLSVNSPGGTLVSYAFTVSGTVSPSTEVPDELPHDEASVDPDDTVDGATVRGATMGGVDSFAFAGDLEAFAVTSDNCGAANVWIDGDRVDACALEERLPDPDAGSGADATVITGPTTIDEPGEYVVGASFSADASPAVDVVADDVVLDGDGNEISADSSGGTGVRIAGENATVRDLAVSEWDACVAVTDDGAEIANCDLSTDSGTGLVLEDAADCTVADSSISGAVGADLAGASGTAFRGNEVSTVGNQALSVTGSDGGVFEDNELIGTFGVTLSDVRGTVLRGNVVEGGPETGVLVSSASGVELVDNDVADSNGGVTLVDVSGGDVSDNRVTDNDSHGIHLDGSSDVAVTDNTVRDNGTTGGGAGGIVLAAVRNSEVRDNTVCDNAGPGQIVVDDASSGNVVTDNDTC